MRTYVDVSAYQILTNGRCPSGSEIKSLSECSAAAKYLNLYDRSASSDNQPNGVSYDPPFCYHEGSQLKFNGGRNYGSCNLQDRCLCSATTYHLVNTSRCQPGREVKSLSECSAAAKYLNLSDQSASSDNQYGSSYDPPFCCYEGSQLKFNAGNNGGYCNWVSGCLCAGPRITPLSNMIAPWRTPRPTTRPTTKLICRWKADGECDDSNNNAKCDWDGGDCCSATVSTGYVNTRWCNTVGCE